MEIEEFQKFVTEFKTARGWHKHHEPKDLLLGLVEEIGEFRNLIKWEQDAAVIKRIVTDKTDKKTRDEVVNFFGDALWLVSSLAEYCEVDLREAMDLLKTEFEVRFPVEGGK